MLKDYAKKNLTSGLLTDAAKRCNNPNAAQGAPRVKVGRRHLLKILFVFSALVLVFALVLSVKNSNPLTTLAKTFRSFVHPAKKVPTPLSKITPAKPTSKTVSTTSARNDPTQNLALSSNPETDKRDLNRQIENAKQKNEPPAKTRIEPTFEFYRLLAAKGKENANTNPVATKKTVSPVATPSEVSSSQKNLVLRVAIFKNKRLVSLFRARLFLIGLSPKVETLKQQGKTTYKVLLGPFQNKQALMRVKTKLYQHGITIDNSQTI